MNPEHKCEKCGAMLSENRTENSCPKCLEEFCRTNWQAVYAFFRCRGKPREEAENMTQDFLSSYLFNQNGLKSFDPKSGNSRTSLMTALRNFLANHENHENSEKHHPENN